MMKKILLILCAVAMVCTSASAQQTDGEKLRWKGFGLFRQERRIGRLLVCRNNFKCGRLLLVLNAVLLHVPVSLSGISATLHGKLSVLCLGNDKGVPFRLKGVQVLVLPERAALVHIASVLHVGDLVASGRGHQLNEPLLALGVDVVAVGHKNGVVSGAVRGGLYVGQELSQMLE